MDYKIKGNCLFFPKNNRIVLFGDISKTEQRTLTTSLIAFQDNEVHLFIDSPGGHIDRGFDMADAIEAHGNVTGIVTSQASSAAFVILHHCKKRHMFKHSYIMCHGHTIPPLRVDDPKIDEKFEESKRLHSDFLLYLSKKQVILLKNCKSGHQKRQISQPKKLWSLIL
ncbi:ATP-dependent Clp protease proteolytic subunit [Patescibacteria group bacterium]|nr:ATP-dependent Clp protease proteolytic subunit [Patescibacteria group bacterium]